MRTHVAWTCLSLACLIAWSPPATAADQPQWGQLHSRNMVSDEKGLPEWFDPGQRGAFTGEIDLSTTKNVKWVAQLGRQTHGTPVVAEGRVLVGTNNEVPRDEQFRKDAGVLMCFDEQTGEFLWQLVVPKRFEIKNSDWYYIGLCSSPVVESGLAYVVSNRAEVICLDLDGMADGNDGPYTDEGLHMAAAGVKATAVGQPPPQPGPKDADIVWLYDMVAELGVRPHNAANCSVLSYGDFLYVCTSNGVEDTHSRVANPDAPTLIVIDKKTGRLVARDNFGIGGDIIHGQWSSPALGQLADQTVRIFQGAGNGYLYGFAPVDPAAVGDQPLAIEKTWWVNGHPAAQTEDKVPIEHGYRSKSYEVVANPVFHQGHVYLAITQDPFHHHREGWLTCWDASGSGDVTRSNLLWSYSDTGACITTVSIADGLVYVVGHEGGLHCLDAETGKPYWVQQVGGPTWGSTLVADGKVYLGTGRRELWVLEHGKQLKVLSRITMRDRIFTTPVAANGVLYIATFRELYAVHDPAARARVLAEAAAKKAAAEKAAAEKAKAAAEKKPPAAKPKPAPAPAPPAAKPKPAPAPAAKKAPSPPPEKKPETPMPAESPKPPPKPAPAPPAAE